MSLPLPAMLVTGLTGLLLAALAAMAVTSARLTARIEAKHPPVGRLLDIDGQAVHVHDGGAATRDTLVLLHGASANLRDIDAALRDALERRYRVISIDRPGSGWSAARPDTAGDPVAQARVVAEVLRQLDVPRAVWVGHSWGGAVALAGAIELPERIAGAVLLAAPTTGWAVSDLPWPIRLATVPLLGEAFAHTLITPLGRRALPDLLRNSFEPESPPPMEPYAEATAAALSVTPIRFRATARDMTGLPDALEVMTARYADIETPLLLVYGERDPLMSPDEQARPLAAAAGHAELHVLDGAGHLLHHTRSGEVTALVDRFATRVIERSHPILTTPSR